MSIYQSAVKKPITTALIFIAVMLFGIFSFTRLSVDLFPEIETNAIMVLTAYPGASASDIENNVTKPLENTLNSVSDLKHITSKSRENISIITLEFEGQAGYGKIGIARRVGESDHFQIRLRRYSYPAAFRNGQGKY